MYEQIMSMKKINNIDPTKLIDCNALHQKLAYLIQNFTWTFID